MDYHADEVSCYVSDGSAMLTFEAFSETSDFARKWVPFCKKHKIEPSAPEFYFVLKIDYLKEKIQPSFVKEWKAMQRECKEFKVRVNADVAKAQEMLDVGWIMQDGTPWPGNNPTITSWDNLIIAEDLIQKEMGFLGLLMYLVNTPTPTPPLPAFNTIRKLELRMFWFAERIVGITPSSDFLWCASLGTQSHLPESAVTNLFHGLCCPKRKVQTCDFYDHSTGEVYQLPLPQALGLKIVGSAHGWLITASEDDTTVKSSHWNSNCSSSTNRLSKCEFGGFVHSPRDTRRSFRHKSYLFPNRAQRGLHCGCNSYVERQLAAILLPIN